MSVLEGCACGSDRCFCCEGGGVFVPRQSLPHRDLRKTVAGYCMEASADFPLPAPHLPAALQPCSSQSLLAAPVMIFYLREFITLVLLEAASSHYCHYCHHYRHYRSHPYHHHQQQPSFRSSLYMIIILLM